MKRVVVLLVAIAAPALAQTNVGTTAAPFLTLGVGSRATGLGEAFVAVADDATAFFWNPAGAVETEGTALFFQHADWLAGIGFRHAAAITSLPGDGVVGAALTVLDYGEMDVTTVEYQEGTGEKFRPRDLSAAIGYATPLTDHFSVGGQLKFVHQAIWHESATGWAIDLGTRYRFDWRDLTIGTTIANFGTPMRMDGLDLRTTKDLDEQIDGNNSGTPATLDTESWDLPLLFRFGIAADLLSGDYVSSRLAVDAVHPNDNTEHVNVGIEIQLAEFLSARAGWNRLFQADVEGGLTAGVGISTSIRGLGSIRVDYSFKDYGRLDSGKFLSVQIGA